MCVPRAEKKNCGWFLSNHRVYRCSWCQLEAKNEYFFSNCLVSMFQAWHFCQTGHFYSGMTHFTLTTNKCISNIPLFFNTFRQSFKNYTIAKRIYQLDSSINLLSHSSSNCSPACLFSNIRKYIFDKKSVYCTGIYHITVPISDKV